MDALFTHHHYGWRKHDLPNSHPDHLVAALLETHEFLPEYAGKYRTEIERTPALSYDGMVQVFWDSDEPKAFFGGHSIRRGDHWFRAFEFNVADADACRFCGGTGMDHYLAPFAHCWACDGTKVQLRKSTHRGFLHKPTEHAAQASHDRYATYLSAASWEVS